jgi:hypothetical protein
VFGLLGIVDIAILLGLEGYSSYSMVVMLLKFLGGCALLASLIRFSGPLSILGPSRKILFYPCGDLWESCFAG